MTSGIELDLVLVDFDDTLVETAPRFAAAREALFDLLADYGFDRSEAHDVHHNRVDPLLRESHGFGPHRMPEAFVETYRTLCGATGQEPSDTVARACHLLGAAVAGSPFPLAGAIHALRRLARALPTVVYTQAGDAAYQTGCVRDAGALEIVGPDRVRVVPVKTAATFRETLAHFGASPARTCMIGNSLRSDINPALEVGARAILVQIDEPWHHDVVDPLHTRFDTVPSFDAAVRLLLDRQRAA